MVLQYENYFVFFAYIFIINFSNSLSQNTEDNAIKALREYLFKTQNYDLYSRPVKDHKTVTVVTSQLSVIRFIDLDYNGRLTTFAAIQLNWTDEHLRWDPNAYNGLNELVVGVNEVWKPELCNTNSYNMANNDKVFGTHSVYVNSTGNVQWITLAYFETRCFTNLNDYPYDEHNCDIYLESWLYTVNQVNYTTFHNKSFWNYGPYFDNPLWDITLRNSGRDQYDWLGSEYSMLYMTIDFKRRIGYYYNLVQIPYYTAFVLSLIMFAMPPNSKQRYQIGFIIILMMTALIISIGAQFKNASQSGAPKSLQNIATTMFTVCITLAVSTFIARFVAKWSSLLPPQPMRMAYILDYKIMKLLGSGYFPVEQFELEFRNDFRDLSAQKLEQTVHQQEWITFALIIDKILLLIYLLAVLIRHA